MPEVIQHKYVPRPQMLPFHARTQRMAMIVAHRRFGKTVAVVNDMMVRAMRTKKPKARYGYIAPTYGMAKEIAWEYMKAAVRDVPGVVIRESETALILPNEAKVRCFGVDKADNLRGQYFDGVVCDEFGEWDSRAWSEVIRPAIADRKGWAVFIGTPKGKNKFYELRERARGFGPNGAEEAKRWLYIELKASETGVLPKSELDDARIDMDEDEYAQEFECSFEAANKGTYYAKHMLELERNNKLVNDRDLYVPYEKVSVAMDLGFDDATAMWFWQVVDGEVRFIDYWEESGYDADEVCQLLEMKPYDLETVWLPHDAKHHTFRSHKSILDVFREYDLPARIVPNPDAGNRVIHGVNAVRKTLRTYPLQFDAVRCARGLEALRNYSRKYDRDANVFSEKAKHDQWSHGADAFRYACLAFNKADLDRSLERAAIRRSRLQATQPSDTDSVNTSRWTFNDAWRAQERQLAARRSSGRSRI